jgi:hypothetical protein
VKRLLILAVVASLAAAACSVAHPSSGAATDPGATTTPTSSGAATTPVPTEAPPATEVPATEAPTEPPATATPTAVPTAPPASSDPGDASGAEACTGSDDNRDFLASVARNMDWTVLCAVLPRGWVVDSGSYRLAGGGRMEMAYRSRAGGRLELSEGAFCGDADGCVPAGTETGDAAFGPLDGTLIALDDGGWAIVADRGAEISWLLVAHGVDEAAARSFGEALEVVGE